MQFCTGFIFCTIPAIVSNRKIPQTIATCFLHCLYSTSFLSYQDCQQLPITLFLSRQGPEVIKLFSCSTQLSMKFILLINVKMPTIVGILTFISMIDTTSERLEARNFFICRYFSFYEQLKFSAQLS